MISTLLSFLLGKATDGVPTDPCKEATPDFNAHSSLPSEGLCKALTHLNKTHAKLPIQTLTNPPSYLENPSLWPVLENPAPRPCIEINPMDWQSVSSTMTPPSLDWSGVASTPQQNIQPSRKHEEGVFDMEMDREKAALEMLGVEEFEDHVTYDPIRWKLWQERDSPLGSRFSLQLVITPVIRSQLLKWLSSQGRKLACSLEAWCLAVNYLDRFMCVQSMGVADYGLAGITALFIASKQVDPVPVVVERLCISTASSNSFNVYCKAEYISQMEEILLDALNNQLDVPTITYFLSHLSDGVHIQEWLIHFERHMVEMVLIDRLLSKHSPSKIALAIFDMTKALNSHKFQSISPLCPKCDPKGRKPDEDDLIDKLFEDLATVLIQNQ